MYFSPYLFFYDLLGHIPPLFSFLFSAVGFFLLAVLRFFLAKKSFYPIACLLLHTFCSACFFAVYEVPSACFACAITLFYNLIGYIITKLPYRKRKKKSKKQKMDELAEEILTEERPPVPSAPVKKVLVENKSFSSEEEVYRLSEENISLSHVLGVALKLKKAKLSVTDRLETDNIYRTLCLYRAKDSLTAEEANSLNGYLATLLKFTAKYSL